jgi:hypothetical protein
MSQELYDRYAAVGVTWLPQILTLDKLVKRGAKGVDAKRVQEMLWANNQTVSIDEDFGAATERAVADFQRKVGLAPSGEVDARTWQFLVRPFLEALQLPDGSAGVAATVWQVAMRHLAMGAKEYAGNRGPWVRLYMRNHDGPSYPWCAGFASFMIHQAAAACRTLPVLPYTWSCDQMAENAKKAHLFVPEADVKAGKHSMVMLFLNRRVPGDWTHTGIAFDFTKATFRTIEGNSNSVGSREGTHAVRLVRTFNQRDFITIPGAPEITELTPFPPVELGRSDDYGIFY